MHKMGWPQSCFGGRDKVADVAEVDTLRAGLDRAGVPSDLKVYPEATHSFLAQYTGPLGMLMRARAGRATRRRRRARGSGR